MSPRRPLRLVLLLLLLAVSPLPAQELPPPTRPELEYLKIVNDAGPVQDPQLLFLLMAQYQNANRLTDGIAHFERLLEGYGPGLTPPQRALYLSALGLLRATQTANVSLLLRIGWVRQTSAIFDEAKSITDGRLFLARWGSGIFHARVPALFGRQEAAIEDLEWCLTNADQAPSPGWLREATFHLALLIHNRDASDPRAMELLQRSGYPSFEKRDFLTTPFAVNAAAGATFAAPRIREVVPGSVWALSGFEFTEYYFIRSADRQQLIAIDAGTRSDSARAAYDALRSRVGELPPLTTVFITHAHWDHIGGHEAFRALHPGVTFYGRENSRDEIEIMLNAPRTEDFEHFFFGEGFSMAPIRSYRPDVEVSKTTTVTIGGTEVRLIPVGGGETLDALFIFLPGSRVLFVGDFIMPFFGAPFLEEGNLEGLFAAIDTVQALAPSHLLHGHEPLTRVFTPPVTAQVKRQLEWLRAEVRTLIRAGTPRSEIHRRNLVPPFIAQTPDAQLAYLVVRENFINRLFDQSTGYWQSGLVGLDHLAPQDIAYAYARYFGLSDSALVAAVDKMLEHGDLELAARTIDEARLAFPASEPVRITRVRVYERLREKYQEFNPFKFFIYSGQIGRETPQMP